MNVLKIISVFLILLAFALSLGFMFGLVFQVEYGNIAVIKIHGEISSGSGGLLASTVNSQSIVNKLDDANTNALIEAIIIDINSGGGSSVACSEIVDAVKRLDKPTVAFIRDVGASGAYWVASACDYIIAHKLSLTGSLGVNMNYLEYSGLLDIFNVSYVNLSYPEHKDILSQYRPLTDLEREWVTVWLEEAYDYFISDVASNRGWNKSELIPFANGSIFLGSQAFDYGLIDGLGGWHEAYNKTIELANITLPVVTGYNDEYSILDLISGFSSSNGVSINT
jgi:protease-4